MTDTVRLEEEILKSGLKKSWIAEKLGLTAHEFYQKRKNKNQFKAGEIKMLCYLLKITSLEKVNHIFFMTM